MGFEPSVGRYVSIIAATFLGFLFQGNHFYLPYPALEAVESNLIYASLKPSPLIGTSAPNQILASARKVLRGQVEGPESVAFDADGNLYLSDTKGYISVSVPPFKIAEEYAYVGGLPLGMTFDNDDNLIVCVAPKGLYKIEKGTKRVIQLAARISPESAVGNGTEILFADAVDVAKDGTIYFSDATNIPPFLDWGRRWDGMAPSKLNAFQGGQHGRIVQYNPTSGEAKVISSGFFFANGVALAEDESYLVIAETLGMRLFRLWLTGPKEGKLQVFAANLPCMPDNVNLGSSGTFWVGCPSLPLGSWKLAALRFNVVRWAAAWAPYILPSFIMGPPAEYGMILEIDGSGQIVRSFQDKEGSMVTSALEYNNKLYVGSLTTNFLRVLNLEKI